MDLYSSGEDLVIKTRKPYTITKQRERWTEEEHNRFLEALKLYGRAWQRIEEHIGTKTVVQIRSHAQKFFTKLEKEAIVKGFPIGHALDIEIPPPRPKRKPSNPYPRNTSVGAPTPQVGVKNGNIPSPVSSSCQSKITVALENEPEEPCDDGKLGSSNEYREKNNCSEAFTLVKTAPCSSPSPADAPKKSCTFRQYVSLSKEGSNHQDETAASQVTIEAKGIQSDYKQPFQDNAPFNVTNSYLSHEKTVHSKRIDELKQSEYVDKLATADMQGSQNYPRHAPVHILDTNCKFHQMSGVENLFINQAASAATCEHYSNASISSVHHSFSSYHPPIQNQDDYQSFLHKMFSSLIVSALSQNPAASYAAAEFAATLWPCVNLEAAPLEQPSADGASFQARPTTSSTPPSMAAIAAATVAAATAWWAAHGLLPICAPPSHPAFSCSPATPVNNSSQGRAVNSERRENSPPALGGQQLEPECSGALHEHHSVLKSPILSTSEFEASEDAKLNVVVGLAAETAKVAYTVELHEDANKSKNKKLVDRSSCGSNTPSGTEVEAEKEENHMKDKEETEELDAIHPVADPFSRRCRSTSNVNDSWKEVSEEGRLAFKALFSREVLPQSFLPPHDVKNKGKKILIKESVGEKGENGLGLDLNGKTWVVTSCPQKHEVEDNASLIDENKEEGLLNMRLGHFKLKDRQTGGGFKPYKRCSMEAEESRVSLSSNNQDEEKGPKRLRLEGEAST